MDGYVPAAILHDEIAINDLPDLRWLAKYEAGGSRHGPPILLSLGESWLGPPPALAEALGRAPRSYHGYHLSMFGLPALRRELTRRLIAEHRLTGGLVDALVAVSCSGTRGAMADFAQVLNGDPSEGPRTALIPSPGWDYEGVFASAGFRVEKFELAASDAFQPRPAAIRDLLSRHPRGPGTVLVLNPQHNPTGANWLAEAVAAIAFGALDRGVSLLVDDAYYGLVQPGCVATSALRSILELSQARGARSRWLAVRSLGKQFRCNGWGIGSLAGDTDTIRRLANRVRPFRSYNIAAAEQFALAEFLAGPGADEFLELERARLAANRARVEKWISESGLAREAWFAGPAAPYAMLRLTGAAGAAEVLQELASNAGVVLTTSSPGTSGNNGGRWLRLYYGVSRPVLEDALRRLTLSGLARHLLPSAIAAPPRAGAARPSSLPVGETEALILRLVNEELEVEYKSEGCSRCAIPALFPNAELNPEGLCRWCRAAPARIWTPPDLHRAVAAALSSASPSRGYDCIALYSGGRNSSVALRELVGRYGLRVLAVTFDNAFQADAALDNALRICTALRIDHTVVRPQVSSMVQLFSGSLKRDWGASTLSYSTGGCGTCIGAVMAAGLRLCRRFEAPLLAGGWTPGQLTDEAVLPESFLEELVRGKAGSLAAPPLVARELFDAGMPGVQPVLVNPLYAGYDEEEHQRWLDAAGWKRPAETDSCSSNCRMNSLLVVDHLLRFGYHPYVFELAGHVRRRLLHRGEALARMEKPGIKWAVVRQVAEAIGYRNAVLGLGQAT